MRKLLKIVLFLFSFSILHFLAPLSRLWRDFAGSFFILAAPPPITGTPVGEISGLGPLGTIIELISPTNVAPASNRLASTLSSVIGIITITAGVWFLIQLLIAGFNWITASGAKDKLQASQDKITQSIVGMVIVVAAYAVTNLLGKLLGIPNILDIGGLINQIVPR